MNNLFTDDNPKTTLKGLGFSNLNRAKLSIKKVEEYFNLRLINQEIPGFTSAELESLYKDMKDSIQGTVSVGPGEAFLTVFFFEALLSGDLQKVPQIHLLEMKNN